MSTISNDFSAITTLGSLNSDWLETATLFNTASLSSSLSAIDNFLTNSAQINRLWINENSVSSEFGRILLLGYVSAVESYFRSLFTSIINGNVFAKANAHSSTISFGAALYHKKSFLPEALLEGYSFAGKDDVKKAFNKFLCTDCKDISPELFVYEKICQIRHCCIHRFGKLGSQNGIVLGLEYHKNFLERPLNLDKIKISEIANWLTSFVKSVNNYAFKVLLDKSIDPSNQYKINWSGTFSKDKSRFKALYNICATTQDAIPSPGIEEMYNRFKNARRARFASLANNTA